MELRQLEHFLAVAEELSFTRAAERLRVYQSGLSASVRNLERDLGAPLFDRSSKHVDLTEVGRRFVPEAYAVLEAAQHARDTVAEETGELTGTVRLGTMTSVRLVDVPAILGEYHRRHPHVQLLMSAASSGSGGLLTALRERRLDLAFVATRTAPAGVRLIRLAGSQLQLVVPQDHELAARRRVSMADLAGRSFIDAPEGYGTRSIVDAAFSEADIRRQVTLEITDLATGLDYVRAGLGIAFLPDYLVGNDQPPLGVKVVPISPKIDLGWPLSLAVRRQGTPSAATRALVSLVREHQRTSRTAK